VRRHVAVKPRTRPMCLTRCGLTRPAQSSTAPPTRTDSETDRVLIGRIGRAEAGCRLSTRRRCYHDRGSPACRRHLRRPTVSPDLRQPCQHTGRNHSSNCSLSVFTRRTRARRRLHHSSRIEKMSQNMCPNKETTV